MLKLDIKKLLALITVAGFFAIIVALLFVTIPQANLDLAKTMIIALIAIVSAVAGYYFGSSDGSARKTELMLPPPPFVGVDLASPDGDKTVTAIVKTDAGFIRPSLLFLVAAFAVAVALTGCATTSSTTPSPRDTPLQTAGKSLLAVKSTIVTAATATDALCKAGKILPGQCTQAKAAYELAKPAYDAAVDAYLLMTSTGSDSADFARSIARVQTLAASLLTLAGGVQ